MPIQYYMRAYHTVNMEYVDWVVNDHPDSAGIFSGHTPGDLENITVNKVVQSKIENFLKPLVSSDGYYFHLNSYDWLHATPPGPPIPVPTRYVGVATVRGSVDGITPRDFATMTWDEAEQRWKFIFNTNGDHLTLGAYIPINTGSITVDGYFAVGTNPADSGVIRIPNNQFISSEASTSTHPTPDPGNDIQMIAVDNVNRILVGNTSSQQVYIQGNARVDGYVRDGGADPATIGFVRNSNNTAIVTFRTTGATNVTALSSNTSNHVVIGDIVNSGIRYNTATGNIHQFQINTTASLDIGLNSGASPFATSAFIRFDQLAPTPLIGQTARTSLSGQTLSVRAQETTAGGQTGGILSLHSGLGAGFNGTIDLNTGSTLKIRIHPTTAPTAGDNNSIEIFENLIRFDELQVNPRIRQDEITTTSTNGQTLTLQSQNAAGATSNGGPIVVQSGGGTNLPGTIDFQTGGTTPSFTPVSRMLITASGFDASSNTTSLMNINSFQVSNVMSAPTWQQNSVSSPSTNGQTFTFQAQNALGTTSIGGDIVVAAGSGTTRDGYVRLKTGSSDRVLVTQTQTIVYGDLLVNGTTTSITSTVVELADRVIHVNSSANQFPGTVVPTPTQITGFSVDRGSSNPTTKRDYHGLFWSEDDGYWRLAINTDGYAPGSENTLTGTLPLMASTFFANPNAAHPTTLSVIPTVGGFRSLNNTVHSASRNDTGTDNLELIRTDTANKIIWGADTINTGSIFRTSVGTVFDFQEATVSQVQIFLSNIRFTSAVVSPIISHQPTANSDGYTLTLRAQNATTNGGLLAITSGAGSAPANDGYVQVQTGGIDRLVVRPTYSEFRDTAEAIRITPVSAGTTQITFASTVTAASINQTVTGGATGADLTVQAQNAATTGGNLIHTSGTGVTAGNIQLQTGAVDRVVIHPAFTEFRDAAEAVRITPVSAGTTEVTFASTVTAVSISQTTTGAATGATTTIQAQNAATTGGELTVTSGTGGTTNGAINLQVGGVTTASLVTNKFVLNAGKRRHTTSVTTTYPVVETDDFIAITTLAAPFTITLPATPTDGDEYQIKDTTGNAGISNVTVDGNGNNIDGIGTFLLSQPYAAATFTFVNGQWSVS